jgi:hypothetical protein
MNIEGSRKFGSFFYLLSGVIMKFFDVDRATFEQLDPARQIIHAPHSHRFAIVEGN